MKRGHEEATVHHMNRKAGRAAKNAMFIYTPLYNEVVINQSKIYKQNKRRQSARIALSNSCFLSDVSLNSATIDLILQFDGKGRK